MTETKFKMVDNEKMATQVKTALAKMVLPETLDDIEEYLKPEFPPRYQRKAREIEDDDEEEVNGRRIVVDGFGRWREIRPKKYIQKKKLSLNIDHNQLPQMKELFRINSSVTARQEDHCHTHDNQSYTFPGLRSRYNELYQPTRQPSRQDKPSQLKQRYSSEDDLMYDSLGKTTRSNVFPGIGKFQWNSTTSRTFTKQPITAVNERKNFFGIQTDDFGAWSAANVLNERMKKAWEEYLASAPKATANWNPPTTQQAMPKPPPPKPKKNPPKTKKAKKENIVTEPSPLQEPALPSEPPAPQAPPPYVPDAEDEDDNFWEFYDKPFNKPR